MRINPRDLFRSPQPSKMGYGGSSSRWRTPPRGYHRLISSYQSPLQNLFFKDTENLSPLSLPFVAIVGVYLPCSMYTDVLVLLSWLCLSFPCLLHVPGPLSLVLSTVLFCGILFSYVCLFFSVSLLLSPVGVLWLRPQLCVPWTFYFQALWTKFFIQRNY